VSTHAPLQSVGVEDGQLVVQANVPEPVGPQYGAPDVQAAVQDPQCCVSRSEVAHPVPASAQSAYPSAH
jgi:hypothetical protein